MKPCVPDRCAAVAAPRHKSLKPWERDDGDRQQQHGPTPMNNTGQSFRSISFFPSPCWHVAPPIDWQDGMGAKAFIVGPPRLAMVSHLSHYIVSYGLCSYGLCSYGLQCLAFGLGIVARHYIVMAYIVMAYSALPIIDRTYGAQG